MDELDILNDDLKTNEIDELNNEHDSPIENIV